MTVRNLNLVESVYADLKQRLQFSEVGPDDRLVDTEIAEAYGASRMPVREALLRLVAEGYLIGSTRGFVLPTLTAEDISGLFELRRQLEPRAAAAAARDMRPQVIDALAVTMETIRAAHLSGNSSDLIRASVAFRNGWVSCVANPHMARTIARFMDYFQALRRDTFVDVTTRQAHVDGLEAQYQAFRDRDPLAAQDRMTAFLFAAEAAFLAACKRNETSGTAFSGGKQRGRQKSSKREP